jgi:hypothetical protein
VVFPPLKLVVVPECVLEKMENRARHYAAIPVADLVAFQVSMSCLALILLNNHLKFLFSDCIIVTQFLRAII